MLIIAEVTDANNRLGRAQLPRGRPPNGSSHPSQRRRDRRFRRIARRRMDLEQVVDLTATLALRRSPTLRKSNGTISDHSTTTCRSTSTTTRRWTISPSAFGQITPTFAT